MNRLARLFALVFVLTCVGVAACAVLPTPNHALFYGDYVVVTGISTMFMDESLNLRRQILPLTVGGIAKLWP